jgi:hypothetical protein
METILLPSVITAILIAWCIWMFPDSDDYDNYGACVFQQSIFEMSCVVSACIIVASWLIWATVTAA